MPSTWSVVVTGAGNMVQLDDGLAETGSATPYAMTYFQWYMPRNPFGAPPKGFEVSLVPLTGSPIAVYINDEDEPETRYPTCNGPCAAGNISHYYWSSLSSDSRSRVVGE